MTTVISGWLSKYFSEHTYKLWSKEAVWETEVWGDKDKALVKRKTRSEAESVTYNTEVSLHRKTSLSGGGTEQGRTAR